VFTVFGANTCRVGVSGYDAAETADEDPERGTAVQLLPWGYLGSEFYSGDSVWQIARGDRTTGADGLGSI